ncbi:MAG: hypothetical protein IJY53_10085 [Akkermansia sp.]|nr:hypothetical protein [Akkermansia sp.]
MKKSLFLLSSLVLPAMGTEMPPMIPDGPVTYEDVTYEDPMAGFTDPYAFAEPAPAAAPITPSVSSGEKAFIKLNLYQTNYQVRGMGVTDPMASNGYSSISGHYVLPNRNLFNAGLYQKVSGNVGVVWGATAELADTPVLTAGYAIGKELFPNLTLELGYNLRHGGLEGYMARFANSSPHRLAQDLTVTLAFNDHQKGFFGSMQWGIGFQGLTGHYLDAELGYRFTNVVNTNSWGLDLEVSAGWAGSFSYWANGVKGTDAGRLRIAAPVFTHGGGIGRDGRTQITPWAQLSASGNNAGRIDRAVGGGPVDHFQVTFGVEFGWKF